MEVNIILSLIIVVGIGYIMYRNKRKTRNRVDKQLESFTSGENSIGSSVEMTNPVFYIIYGNDDEGGLTSDDIPVLAEFVINFNDIKNREYEKEQITEAQDKVYVEFKTINITKLLKVKL